MFLYDENITIIKTNENEKQRNEVTLYYLKMNLVEIDQIQETQMQ